MGCSECKKKQTMKEEMLESSKFVSNAVVWFVIVWSGFAIYGIYTLISKLI
jgi:hypothetical protein